MSTNQVKKTIKSYLALLRKKKINFKEAYLFGSYARGNYTEYSDIDLALVFKKVKTGQEYYHDKLKLTELASTIEPKLEPIILTESEIKGKDVSPLAFEVVSHGTKIE